MRQKRKEEEKKEILRYRENPFYTEAEARRMAAGQLVGVVRRRGRGVTTIDSISGEVLTENQAIFAQEDEVDTQTFVKTFSGAMKEFFKLEESARKVFEIVWYQIERHPNQEQITLHETMAEEYGIKRSTWFKGIITLIDREIIARHVIPNVYFFNPKLAWNGDRMMFMRRVVRKKDLDKNLSLFSAS